MRTSRTVVWGIVCVCLSACAHGEPAVPQSGPPASGWRHPQASARIAAMGAPRHAAVDAIANPGAPVVLEAKLAYGQASKDLEDEDVTAQIWIDGEWREAGRAITDGDGRARITTAAPTAPGLYRFAFVVAGDGSTVEGAVQVIERGSEVVLFDIDGTLTSGDLEFFREVVHGEPSTMQEGASEVAAAWSESGVTPVYLTGRHYAHDSSTREWLDHQGFPPGPVILAQSFRDSRPSANGVQRYKRELIERLRSDLGLRVRAAYGNAGTDVCAYAEAGIPPRRTFIIGDHGGEACAGHPAPEAVRDYRSHLRQLEL